MHVGMAPEGPVRNRTEIRFIKHNTIANVIDGENNALVRS